MLNRSQPKVTSRVWKAGALQVLDRGSAEARGLPMEKSKPRTRSVTAASDLISNAVTLSSQAVSPVGRLLVLLVCDICLRKQSESPNPTPSKTEGELLSFVTGSRNKEPRCVVEGQGYAQTAQMYGLRGDGNTVVRAL